MASPRVAGYEQRAAKMQQLMKTWIDVFGDSQNAGLLPAGSKYEAIVLVARGEYVSVVYPMSVPPEDARYKLAEELAVAIMEHATFGRVELNIRGYRVIGRWEELAPRLQMLSVHVVPE